MNLVDISLNVNTCEGVMPLHLLHSVQFLGVNETIRLEPAVRGRLLGLSFRLTQFLPQICSLLEELVVLKPVSVGSILVHDLLQVGKPLPVEPGDLLVPEPVGIVGDVGQGSVSTDLEGNQS